MVSRQSNLDLPVVSTMCDQAAVRLESLLAKVAREGSTFVFRYVIIVIPLARKAFMAFFTPIAVNINVTLIVRTEPTFATECLLASWTMVLPRVMVKHAKNFFIPSWISFPIFIRGR